MNSSGEPPNIRAAAVPPAARPRSAIGDALLFVVALVLAALAGFIDAAGFVAFGGLFVSFMAGDGTRAAIDVSGRTSAAVAPALAIVVFVAGIVLGELIGAASGRWGRVTVLVVETILLWLAVAVAAGGLGTRATVTLLGLAMGVQNASVHRTEGVDVALTYVTGMVVHFARAIAKALRGEGGWSVAGPLGALWGAILAGSLAGGAIARYSSLTALVVAASLASVMTGVMVAMTLAHLAEPRLP